ncbi:MAG: malonate decarboxylase subunit epsilon [Alcaligenes sp.]
MALALLCSGQGSQHAGMFDLTGAAPAARDVFEYAALLLGEDPRSWIHNATDEQRCVNRTAQVLCVVQAVAAHAMLRPLLPRRLCVAGYSVGELASWAVAGLLPVHAVLDVAITRAQAMDAASSGDQGMLFVRGLSQAEIQALCQDRQAAVAIVNPGQAWVIGGRLADLTAIAVEAAAHGANRVAHVPVAVASHTFLLADAVAPVSDALHQAVPATARTAPGTRVFSGIDARVVLNVDEGLNKLARQIAEPIQWEQCLQACVEAGATAFLELGPGRALADMAASAFPRIPARSLDDFRTLQGVSDWLARLPD